MRLFIDKLDKVFPEQRCFRELFQVGIDENEEFARNIGEVLSVEIWKEISCEAVECKLPAIGIVMNVLTPEAYAYFLPAFIRCNVLRGPSAYSDAMEWLLPPSKNFELRENMRVWWDSFVSCLSREQKEFIYLFLKHVESMPDPDYGLAHYRCWIGLHYYWKPV